MLSKSKRFRMPGKHNKYYGCNGENIRLACEPITIEVKAEIMATLENETQELPYSQEERINSLLRIKHLNEKKRKARICIRGLQLFYLEEKLTCTGAIKHEIAARAGIAPANTRPNCY